MRTVAFAVFLAAANTLASVAAHAAPTFAPPPATTNPSIVPAQAWQHWWEHEHEGRRARERYWRLPPAELDSYNTLQARINELQRRRQEIDERIRDAVREQHRLLGFRGR